MKTIRKLARADVYDLDGIQNWLEQMSAKGLHILQWGLFWCKFQRGDPKQVHYRLDPARSKEDLDEVKENYQALGWRYVCHVSSSFRLFAAEDPAAPELYNDSDSMAYAMKSVSHSAAMTLLLYLCFLLFFLSTYFVKPDHNGGSWIDLARQLTESRPFPFAYPLSLLCAVLLSLHASISLLRIRRALRCKGTFPHHPRHFLPVSPVLSTILLIGFLLLLINDGAHYYFRSQGGYSDPSSLTFPIVSLSELENHPEFELEAFRDNYEYSFHPLEGSYVYSLPSFRTPICLNICQSGLIKSLWWDELVEGYRHNRYEPSLYIQLWETRGTAWAKTIYLRLTQSDQTGNWDASLQPLALDWADQAVLAVSQENALQQIILRCGNRVANIQYNGVQFLEE